jgi:hypothetical protein
MLDRILPLLLLAGILGILYRAFLHSPRTPPSGKNHEESVTNYSDAHGRFPINVLAQLKRSCGPISGTSPLLQNPPIITHSVVRERYAPA